MEQGIFSLDGKTYNIRVLELKRKFAVTDTGNSGRTADYAMHRDIIGTFYNYTIKVMPVISDMDSYNNFYEAISNPSKDKHTLTVPFANETLTFTAYITQGEDDLLIRNGKNYWGMKEGLTINFIAMSPQRRH
jgi:hypothetical protein|nr:MAG TPA: hypothetical protein [Caudoviricetes sp.]